MSTEDVLGGQAESPTRPLRVHTSLLIRNSLLNLCGQVAPLAIGLFAIPLLVHGLGIDRFGVLTLAWLLIGYFSLFDLGMAKALTQVVAGEATGGESGRVGHTVWTAWIVMLLSGLVGAVIACGIAPWMVDGPLNISPSLRAETLPALLVLGLSIPVVIVTAGIRGVLEAVQRFGFISALRVLNGAFSYIAPVVMLSISDSLLAIVSVLALGRVIVLVAHLVFCLHVVPGIRVRPRFSLDVLVKLLRLGGWITVSNVISPVMAYLDRFAVAAMVSAAAVAYYATPLSMVTNVLAVPFAITGVLFPAFAAAHAREPLRTTALLTRGFKVTLLLLLPITVVIVALARSGMRVWLGEEFALHSAAVLQVLTVGILFNGCAQVPSNLIQSVGRADLTARLHLLEVLPYVAVMCWATAAWGILGTAVVWSARTAIDLFCLLALARRAAASITLRLSEAEVPASLAAAGLIFAALSERLASWTAALAAVVLLASAVCFAIPRGARVVSVGAAVRQRFARSNGGGIA